MRQIHVVGLVAAMLVVFAAHGAGAQERRRSPGASDAMPAEHGIPRDARFPYAGLWSGTRIMPVGSDHIRFRFSVVDGKYSGVTIHPGGDQAPQENLTATAAGLTWEQPNSGGGTWVFASGSRARTAWWARSFCATRPPISRSCPAGRWYSRASPLLLLAGRIREPPMRIPSRPASLLESLARDLRYGARSLRSEPTFVAGVVLTFALAIGTNAAMFGLVTRLMLAPPPGIANAERVAQVRLRHTDEDGAQFVASTTSYPNFLALHSSKGAFAAVAATTSDTMAAGRSPNVQQIAVLGATGDYFATLGAAPALGRFFGRGDDELPRGSSVIVLSHAYWERAFAGDGRCWAAR